MQEKSPTSGRSFCSYPSGGCNVQFMISEKIIDYDTGLS